MQDSHRQFLTKDDNLRCPITVRSTCQGACASDVIGARGVSTINGAWDASLMMMAIMERRSKVGQLYSDNDQEEVSRNAIEALARETSRPFDDVKEVYESEFARLSADARISAYLILFESRRT